MRAALPWRGRLRDRRGTAASEFAIVLPVLMLVLFSVHDIADAMWRTTRLEMAARAGAQYAFSKPQDAAGIAAAVRGQLTGWNDVTVAPATMTCRCDNGAAADCTTGTCVVGTVTHAPIGYVSITVTKPYTFLSPLTARILPQLATLRGNVELRLH